MKEGCVSQQTKPRRSVSLPVLKAEAAPEPEKKASRASRWRAASLVALSLLMVVHVVQWWLTGWTVSPIEPSEAMYTLQNGAINAGFIFFSLAILGTLIFGRFVCGWGCHIVALQDLCAWLLNKMGMKPRPFRSRLLVFVPLIVALYMFVWPTVLRFLAKPANEPLFPAFSNHLITTEFWATFPPFWVAVPFLFVCGFMTVYFLGSKGFCTYACPYGGFFGVADRFAPGRIRVNDSCNNCGHCTAACTSNVLVHAEVREFGMVTDPGCMKCMDCVSVCPNDALYFGFGRPAIGAGAAKRNYSLTWGEEVMAAVVFFVSFISVWDVYQIVPMLMALGIACVTTFLFVRVMKVVGRGDVSFYRYSLRSGGRIRKAGWAFLVFAVMWIGLNAHSGLVRYHESSGTAAFRSLQIPDDLALAQSDPREWLSASDRENVAQGAAHLRTATDIGLLANFDTLPKLAWFEFLSGDAEKALGTLEEASRHQQGPTKAVGLYFHGAILNRLGRPAEAITSLNAALAERPDLTTALEEKGESYWLLGRQAEAVEAWSDALARNPALTVSASFLAGAEAAAGHADRAGEYEKEAERVMPADAHFNWMVGQRLQNLGMKELAAKRFAKASQLNPAFLLRRTKPAERR